MRQMETRRSGSLAVAALAVGLAAACGAPAENVLCATTEDAVVATLDAVIAADNAGDASASTSLHAEDATWVYPGGEVVKGRDAIAERYRMTFEAADVDVVAEVSAVEIDGARASILGSTTGWLRPRDGNPPIEVDDAFVMQLACAPDATWRISHLAWSPRGEEESDGSADPGDPDGAETPGS